MFPSLRGTISGGGSAPPEQVILDLMEANQAAWDPQAAPEQGDIEVHERGETLHRDVDPANLEVTLGSGNQPRIVDLGFSAVGQRPDIHSHAFWKESDDLSFLKATASIDAWLKASSHFHRPVQITSVIASLPRWDVEIAKQVLERLAIDPQRKLEDLSDDQRAKIVRLLAAGDPDL